MPKPSNPRGAGLPVLSLIEIVLSVEFTFSEICLTIGKGFSRAMNFKQSFSSFCSGDSIKFLPFIV
jgi:hypothetical protein